MQERADLKLSEEVAMQLYGLQHLQLLGDPITGTKCLVAWGPSHLVVTFRGTANMKNVRHDAKVSLQLLAKPARSLPAPCTAFREGTCADQVCRHCDCDFVCFEHILLVEITRFILRTPPTSICLVGTMMITITNDSSVFDNG